MCKKLIFLISFVLVLGLASGASAAVREWTNGAAGDDQWNNAGNWSPAVVPVAGDLALIFPPPVRGPVIGSNADAGEIGGVVDQILDIASGNVNVGWWWDLASGGSGTTTVNMVGDANATIGGMEGGYSGHLVINIGGTTKMNGMYEMRVCNEDEATVELNISGTAEIITGDEKNAWRFADKGTMVTNISGNPNIVINGKWRNGDETGHSIINMSGGSLYVDRYLSCYDDGMATISFSGGTVNVDGLSYAGGGGDLAANPYVLNVSGSANITARTEIRLGYQADPLNVTQASVTLNQTGGTLQTPGSFNAFGAKCPVNMSLTGGELRCGSFQDQADVRPYSLYICGGKLIIDGDVTAQIAADIAAGYITGCAYGGPPQVVFSGGVTTLSTPTEYEWTNAYPWSDLWISPWNWDPVGVPSSCDDRAIIPAVGPIVVDTDITVGSIRGPGVGASADADMYVIKSANLVVCSDWRLEETVPYTATIWVADDAKVEIDEDFRSHDEHSRCIMNLSDNAEFIIGGDLRVGDNSDEYFELNMTGDSFLSCTERDDGFRQNNGELHVDLSGNAILQAEYTRWRARTDLPGVHTDLTIRENAQFIITDGDFRAFGGTEIYTVNILDNGVFDIQDGHMELAEDNDFASTITFNMSGQLVNSDDFVFIRDGGSSGFTTVNLTSGLINTEGELKAETDRWLVNICGDGVWVVNGDVVDEIREQEAEGHWMACPMEDCWGEISPRGTLMVEYDTVEYPGKTKIWSYLDLTLPYAPKPADEATDVPSLGTELCWCPGDFDVKLYHVWFSTDADAVANRDVSAFAGQVFPPENCYDPGPLCLCTTYYWAVDSQDHYTNIIRGNVWSFTVECCRAIEDMEAYTMNPDYIYSAWWDGCGDENGMNGNGTGSCVNLTMANTHSGAKAMVYTYETWLNSLWERDANYAEARRVFDEPLDLTTACEAALVVWFYGDRDNGSTQMWVLLNSDGTFPNNDIVGMATYGDNGDDPEDIKKEEWIDWNMKLSDFAAASKDLSNVTSLSIGFGPKATGLEQPGVQGIVLFDDISVCPVRCVPKYTPDICDLNEDCIVDMRDVGVVAGAWLEDRRCNQ